MQKAILPLLAAAIMMAVVVSAPATAEEGDKGMDHKGMGHKGMGHKGMHHNMPSFDDFDLDGDDAITEEEFYKARADRIAKRVAEGRQMKNIANAPSFADIDTDDSGGVDRDEFSAHQAKCKTKHGK